MEKKKPAWSIWRILLLAAALVFLVWFLLSILTGVKPNIGSLTGIAVFSLLALYMIFLPQINRFLKRLWKTTAGKIAEVIVALILAAILTLAGITLGCMLYAAGKEPPPGSTLIVLGCKVNGEEPSLTLNERLLAALDYLEENPDSYVIVTGGQGDGEIVTEASVMHRWLAEHGVPEEKILTEEKAADTSENLKYSEAMLREHPEIDPQTVIVTSDFHVYRAMYIAKKMGMDAASLSAKTPWWLYPTYTVREMYGILESWFLNG